MSDLVTHMKYLERLAMSLLMGKPMPPEPIYRQFHLSVDGFVEPKERQRTGKSGHHYTPKDTREYEAKVKEAARREMARCGLTIILRPITIHLKIRDQIHSQTEEWRRALMQSRRCFEHTGGDLDNKEKAVLDALNKVVYRDDRQVVQVYKDRTYANRAGFDITVTPSGLTKSDLDTIEKLIKAGRKDGKAESIG